MDKRIQFVTCLFVDFLSINLAGSLYFYLRTQTGWLTVVGTPDFVAPMVVLYVYWSAIFAFTGLYQPLYAGSRIDELAKVFKATAIGCLVLFFLIYVDDASSSSGAPKARFLMAVYWILLLTFAGTGRAVVRSVHRRLLIKGIGVHRTLIIGSMTKARSLYDMVRRFPALGFNVVGFVGLSRRKNVPYRDVPVVGVVEELPAILEKERVKEVLVALDSTDHDRLLEILSLCNGNDVSLKIMPDMYDVISGQARTNQIYGFPLIAISPQLMKPWEEAVKRGLDVIVALIILVLGFPFWILIGVAIRLESPGPALYRQERVGKDGVHFNMIKFRSMLNDAERHGPRWAKKKDPRVTLVGRLLRQLHLDEIPQVLNVLKGEMTLIGPRPERPVFVEKLTKEIPLYSRRLKVRPGVTGWAQVKHRYDETIDDVRLKVQYDLFYIENMSLMMDLKIILYTVFHVILGKGR
ncbi:MAG: sugar transferase [Bacteroidota bacterium]